MDVVTRKVKHKTIPQNILKMFLLHTDAPNHKSNYVLIINTQH